MVLHYVEMLAITRHRVNVASRDSYSLSSNRALTQLHLVTERANVRHRRIWTQVHLLNLRNVVLGIAAEVQRVVARNLPILVDNDLAATGDP